jgi:hypothetical protein
MDGDYTRDGLERFDDPATLAVAGRVEVDTNVDAESFFHRIDMHLRDGTVLTVEGDERLIASTDPIEIVRFHRSAAIDKAGVRRLAAKIERLETLGSVADLVGQL